MYMYMLATKLLHQYTELISHLVYYDPGRYKANEIYMYMYIDTHRNWILKKKEKAILPKTDTQSSCLSQVLERINFMHGKGHY